VEFKRLVMEKIGKSAAETIEWGDRREPNGRRIDRTSDSFGLQKLKAESVTETGYKSGVLSCLCQWCRCKFFIRIRMGTTPTPNQINLDLLPSGLTVFYLVMGLIDSDKTLDITTLTGQRGILRGRVLIEQSRTLIGYQSTKVLARKERLRL